MEIIGSIILLLVGVLVGFAINVVSTRLARGKPLLGELGCTRLSHKLTLAQAMPVLGYALQGGKCSTCGSRLSIAYPATELGVGLIFAALFLIDGWSAQILFHAAYVAVPDDGRKALS